MKLLLQCTDTGLVPMYDEDYERKRKLKVGEVYEADVKLKRNIKFHNKAFALLNCCWEYLPEGRRDGFRTKENFRRYLTVAAGYCEVFFSPKRGEFVEYPKSWSFEGCDEAEFEEIYKGVRGVVDSLLQGIVSKETFDKYLTRF